MDIKTLAQVKNALRNGAYAWPGGYPQFFVTSDGASLSFEAVRDNFRAVCADMLHPTRNDQWRITGLEVNWEDGSLYCDHTSEPIPSAYGADADNDARQWFTTSSGRIEIELTLGDAQGASHSGRCDEDVEALARVPYVAAQLATLDPHRLAAELKEYGAWTADELEDHDQNLARILWLAACGIREDAQED